MHRTEESKTAGPRQCPTLFRGVAGGCRSATPYSRGKSFLSPTGATPTKSDSPSLHASARETKSTLCLAGNVVGHAVSTVFRGQSAAFVEVKPTNRTH
jgi:hypothetical protein